MKQFLVIIPALILFLAKPYGSAAEKINIEVNSPTSAKAGKDITISMDIHKSDIKSAARLQLDLPAGLTAEGIDNHGATFTFEDQHAKMTWDTLPAEEEFSVSFKINSERKISGIQRITGEFVYSDNDKTETDPLAAIDINFGEAKDDESNSPQVLRHVTCISPENGEYKVELNIHPNNTGESAQFTDDFPGNFSAELIDSHEASFLYEDHSVKFYWKTLPVDTSFIISYKIHSGKPGPQPEITGVLMYGNPSVISDQPVTKATTTKKELSLNENANSDITKPISSDAIKEISSAGEEKKITTTDENGIVYKIQISANKSSSVKDHKWFSHKYKIEQPVEQVEQDGWHKYLIGNFNDFKEAKKLLSHTQESISEAFIVAYENGNRIPLKEALHNKTLHQ